jgi:hypothetical protein
MKRLHPVLLLLLLTGFLSCKKFIEQQEKKAVLNIITNGQWYVSQYQQNDSDITAAFSGYLFKFDENGIVTGSKDGVSQKGLWVTDVGARTVTASFLTAGPPISLLNETWKITDSYTDRVVAHSTDTVNSTSNILQLRKQ